MPEGSRDATILIAARFQALNRVIQNNKNTMIPDSTIVILFAAFFIEANLNYIIDELSETDAMLDFLYGKNRHGVKYPGLQDKLGWFYNEYIEESKTANKAQMRKNGITSKLIEKFTGFDEIYRFRNNVCHDKLDLSITNRVNAEKFRQQAKNIVNQLFEIVSEKAGYDIPRVIAYQSTIPK